MEVGGSGYRTLLLHNIEQSALDSLVTLEKEENIKALALIGGLEPLATRIGVNLGVGLTKERVVLLRETFGRNEYPETPLVSYFTLLLDALSDTTLLVLLGAAAISLCIGIWQDGPEHGWVEGGSIFIAVFLVANISAGNDYQKQLQFIALENSAASDERASVLREGVIERIHMSEIVVGDVVVLQAGDQIPVDCVLIDNNVILSSQASLTGEAEDVKKSKDKDFAIYSSCLVTQAEDKCLALAIGVGKNSQWGKIKANLVTESVNTPLQDKLEDMTTLIGYIGMVAAAGTFLAMIINIWAKPTKSFPPTSEAILEGVVEAFILSVTIVVVAIPEGLPLAVTIALAYSTKKMYTEQCFIRVLAACETMGNATTICSDKTGTLTENRMTVVCGWFQGKQVEFEEFSSLHTSLVATAKRTIVEHICTNRTSYLVLKNSQGKMLHRPSVIGNATEGALLLMVRGWGHDEEQVKSSCFDEARGDKIFAFSSIKKRSTAVVTNTNDGTTRVFVKGASEWLLRDCTHFIDESGVVQSLTSDKRLELEHIITTMADKALRTLLLAHVDFASGQIDADWPNWRESPPDSASLVLDCIVGIIDPLRGDVKEAVRIAQQAGVIVRMVTGDGMATASAIARQCGILTANGVAMEGPTFRKMTPAQADEILPRLQVMARSSPDDKHLLVTRLNGHAIPLGQREWEERFAQFPNVKWATHRDLLLPGYREEWEAARPEGGQVVGVTGDGTNDAPALKAADVGLAMGITGTKVAQGAADIVILDDRFSSIVNAIKWGRAVYDNIRKFLQFQVTVNIVALLLVFFGAVCGFGQPLTAVQMLWVNLVMDTLGALALGTEAPTDALLMRKPYKRQASLISRPMWRNIACQAAYQLALLFALMFVGAKMFNVHDMSTHPCKQYSLVKSASSSSTSYYIGASSAFSSSFPPLARITCMNFALDCPLVSSKSNQDCFFAAHYASIDLPSSTNSSSQSARATTTTTTSTTTNTFATFKYSELPDFEKKCLTCECKDYTHQTLIFNAFIFCQIFNEYNSRKLFNELNMFSGLEGNYMFLFVSLFSIGAQIMLVEVGGEIVSTTPLSLMQWLITIGFGFLCLPVGVLMRLVPMDEDPRAFFGEVRREEGGEEVVANSINVAASSSSSSLLTTSSSIHHLRDVEMANKASTSYQKLDDNELSP